MISVIGSGCWATAIVKILLEKPDRRVAWWVRSDEVRDALKATGRNPRHLGQVQLDASRLTVGTDLADIVAASDTLTLAVPAAFAAALLTSLPANAYDGKRLVSAVKGYLPECEQSITDFCQSTLHIDQRRLGVVSGPSHAEEVAAGMPTFLTIAAYDSALAADMAAALRCSYIHTSVSNEVRTIELTGLTKNVYAIAAGLAAGLGYGDNLISVLTTAAAHELQGIIPETTLAFSLLSDLIVTCFSRHSRNRALGYAVARGIAPADHFAATGMVAEGYLSARIMHHMATPHPTPIAEAVYQVLHGGADPRRQIDALVDNVL